MNMKVKLWSIFLFVLFLCVLNLSCTEKENSEPAKEKQWVYVELVTKSPTVTTDYFYFGQVNTSIINTIEEVECKNQFFTLYNIRYWNNDDLLQTYEDEQFSGNKVFKIQDIQEITPHKIDPIFYFDSTELHSSTLRIRNMQN